MPAEDENKNIQDEDKKPAENENKFEQSDEVRTTAVSIEINVPTETEEVFKAYKYRFVILIVYSILSAVFGILISVAGPLITTLQKIYDVDIFMVTLSVSLIQFIVYVPSGFFANFVLDKYGLRTGILCGCFFLVIGTWVTVLSEHAFMFIFIGNFIAAIGQPFIFNAPQMVSSTWFLPKERALSTAIGSTSNLLGAGIGFMISPQFVHDDVDPLTGLKQFHKLVLFCAILGTSAAALNVIFFKKQPPTPPSKASGVSKLSTMQSLKSLSKNWNYIIFAVSASLTWGSVNFFGAMVEPMVYPFGYSDSQSGVLAAITIGSGIVGSLIWAAYVDKSKRFKFSIIICSLLTIGFTIFMGAGLFLQKFFITAIATGCMGFFAMPTLSLGFELCAELSFPVAEGTSGGLFVLTSNLVSVFGILAADSLLKGETKADTIYVLLIIVGIQVIALIGFIFFKENLRRTNAEKEANNALNSNSPCEDNKTCEEAKKCKEILHSSHYILPQELLSPPVFRSVASAHV